jgi:hypothetical protein
VKEVTLILSGRLTDPETGKSVMLAGATLTGTPLQVGMIFEHLMSLPGAPDLIGVTTNIEIYRESKLALKRVRCIQLNHTGEYSDPDKTDEDALRQVKELLNLDGLVNPTRTK